MNREGFEYVKECNRRGGMWKFVAFVLFVALVATAISAFMLKRKNKYCNLLVKESGDLPNTPEQEEELKEIRLREWGRAHSMANQKSTEERLEENRIIEEI